MNCQIAKEPSVRLQQLLESANQCVPSIQPQEAVVALNQWQVVDVRQPEEALLGYLPFAINVPRGQLEFYFFDPNLCDPSRTLLVYSNTGCRSLLAAQSLLQLGYPDVYTLAGGIERWRSLDLPLE